jgi:hypothetical protein
MGKPIFPRPMNPMSMVIYPAKMSGNGPHPRGGRTAAVSKDEFFERSFPVSWFETAHRTAQVRCRESASSP